MNMGELIQCPFCQAHHIRENNRGFFYEFFNRKENKKWICNNCGCAFSTEESKMNKMTATSISKEEFFAIIFDAIKEVMGDNVLTIENKKNIEKLYSSMIKTYFKEVALMQAEALYEADCEYHEAMLLQGLRNKCNSKKINNETI